jgi:hypothetical protein
VATVRRYCLIFPSCSTVGIPLGKPLILNCVRGEWPSFTFNDLLLTSDCFMRVVPNTRILLLLSLLLSWCVVGKTPVT